VTDQEQALREQTGRRRRHPALLLALAALGVGLPMIVALAALRADRWFPVLDLAMTEFRVRDVGTGDTPLIGLPGRIGEYPDQGSHPGPLSFYLLAPTYRLLGSSAWALEAGAVVIHVGAIATALWIGYRRAGWRGVAVVAALLALVLRGYGQLLLTQPWNPYLPLVAWIVVLLAAWSVLCDDHLMLIPLVVSATFCAQTHVPYLALAVGMVVLALGGVALQVRRAAPGDRGPPLRSVAWALGIGVVLWLPPVADQLTNEPGNIRQLADHFGSPPEEAIGVGDGIELALRHLDVWSGLAGQLDGTGTFVANASAARGALVLGVWILAAVVATRVGSRALRALHVVVGVALVLGTVSMARIFGRPWYYLTLWAWGVTSLLVGAVLWTALSWWRARAPASGTRAAALVGPVAAGVAGVVTLASAVAFADAEHPEERLSDAVATLSGPTYAALVDGVGAATGRDGVYQVRWSDAADIGSPGFGLLNELERRGLDVAADDFFDVPVTEHRVRPRERADAQVHLATGGYIDAWRAVPEALEVASFESRSPAEQAEYAEIRDRLLTRLGDEGLGDLAPLIDTNLFGMSLDPRLSADDQADLGRMIDLGQPMVVFIAPATTDADTGTP
jgi:hypothetical protein